MANSEIITLRIPPLLRAALDKRLAKSGLTQSATILAALAAYLDVEVPSPAIGRPVASKE